MHHLPPNVIVIWIRGDVTAPNLDTPRSLQAARVLDKTESLVRAGHRVELWTRQCDVDAAETELLPTGVRVRRFPSGDCGSVRAQTPAEYVAEFLARAADRLARTPAHAPLLVSHYWDAGLAGRMLAARFALNHIHVPHTLATEEPPRVTDDALAARELTRRTHEEREACRTATSVIATTRAQRKTLLAPPYAVPANKIFLAPPADDALAIAPVNTAAVDLDTDWSTLLRPTTLGIPTLNNRPLGVESRLLKLAASDDSYL